MFAVGRGWLAPFLVLATGCSRPAATHDERADAGARIMPAVSPDLEQLLPAPPRGFTACTEDGFAHRIDADELAGADLVIAMEDIHVDRLRRLSPNAENVFLLSEFDPDAETGSGLLDPWYGPDSGFSDTLAAVEAAIPGVLDRIRELQRS